MLALLVLFFRRLGRGVARCRIPRHLTPSHAWIRSFLRTDLKVGTPTLFYPGSGWANGFAGSGVRCLGCLPREGCAEQSRDVQPGQGGPTPSLSSLSKYPSRLIVKHLVAVVANLVAIPVAIAELVWLDQWERQRFADAPAGDQHHKTVYTHSQAAGGWHRVFHGLQEVFVELHRFRVSTDGRQGLLV